MLYLTDEVDLNHSKIDTGSGKDINIDSEAVEGLLLY